VFERMGRRWAGQKGLTENLRDLWAPFAARNARYILEESVEPTQELCVAILLWEDVPRMGEARQKLAAHDRDARPENIAGRSIQYRLPR